MVITLVLAAACAILASRRGSSWWKWGLAAAGIDIGLTLLLLAVAGHLGISVRSSSGGAAAIAAAWIILTVPRLAAVVVVYTMTRRATRSPSSDSSAKRRGPTSTRAPRSKARPH